MKTILCKLHEEDKLNRDFYAGDDGNYYLETTTNEGNRLELLKDVNIIDLTKENAEEEEFTQILNDVSHVVNYDTTGIYYKYEIDENDNYIIKIF